MDTINTWLQEQPVLVIIFILVLVFILMAWFGCWYLGMCWDEYESNRLAIGDKVWIRTGGGSGVSEGIVNDARAWLVSIQFTNGAQGWYDRDALQVIDRQR